MNNQDRQKIKTAILNELMKNSHGNIRQRNLKINDPGIKIMIQHVDRPDMKRGIRPGFTSFYDDN